MIKEIIDYTLSIFPKIWNGFYMRGLPDLRGCVYDFKKNILLPLIDEALELSEQWKSRAMRMPGAHDKVEENQLANNESDRVQRLHNNIKWLANNKEASYFIPHTLEIEYLTSIHDKVYTIIVIPPFLQEAKRDHFLISTTKHNYLIQNVRASLLRWNKRVNQHHYYQEEISKMKGSPYEAPYKLYLDYLQVSIELYSKTNELIKTLDKLIFKHRVFWGALLISSGAVFFKDTTLHAHKYIYTQIKRLLLFC